MCNGCAQVLFCKTPHLASQRIRDHSRWIFSLTLGCCSWHVTDNYGGTVLNTPTVQPGVEYAQQVLTQFIACVRVRFRLRACVCIRGLSLHVCVMCIPMLLALRWVYHSCCGVGSDELVSSWRMSALLYHHRGACLPRCIIV
jgi:hypothetical protein